MIRLGLNTGLFGCVLTGWAVFGPKGAAAGLLIGVATLVARWWGQPLWVWVGLVLRRGSDPEPPAPVTVTNDRAAGGVRYQAGIAVTAIRVLGRSHQPTVVAGSTAADTADVLDVVDLLPAMRQSLGLRLESLSLVSTGSRRRNTGDYPPVYDTLIGPVPYAGQRETWLIVRIRAADNADALRPRASVGTATLAATQRIAAELRRRGIRSTVAGAADIVELDDKLGRAATAPKNRHWHSLRCANGWLTTYCYAAGDITRDDLEHVWTLPVDGVTRNVTVFPDRTATATVTLRTAAQPAGSPSLRLRTLPGRQAVALAAGLCGPRPQVRGAVRVALDSGLVLPIGPSGVLLGKLPFGERLMLPLGDPGRPSRIHICAGDAVAKRIVVRMAAAGERITLHTNDFRRWMSVRIPGVTVTDQSRPDAGSTVCVIDGTVSPMSRSGTVVSIGPPGTPEAGADVVIAQTGPETVRVSAAGQDRHIEIEFFRAENRYVIKEPATPEPPTPELAATEPALW